MTIQSLSRSSILGSYLINPFKKQLYENQSAVCTTLTFNGAERASVERREIKLIISIQSWRRGWEDWKVETPVLCMAKREYLIKIFIDFVALYLRVGLKLFLIPFSFCNKWICIRKLSILRNHETNWNSVKMHQIFYIFIHLHFAALMNRT